MKDCKGIEGSLDERSASGRVGGRASRREGDMREADAQQMPKMGFGGEQEKGGQGILGGIAVRREEGRQPHLARAGEGGSSTNIWLTRRVKRRAQTEMINIRRTEAKSSPSYLSNNIGA